MWHKAKSKDKFVLLSCWKKTHFEFILLEGYGVGGKGIMCSLSFSLFLYSVPSGLLMLPLSIPPTFNKNYFSDNLLFYFKYFKQASQATDFF